MPNIEAKKIAKQYARQLKKGGFPVVSLYLFGSAAIGRAKKWSDIDVAVITGKPLGYWSGKFKASRLALRVDNRLEPHIFSKKDFSDLNDPLVYEIRKTGVKIT